MSYFQDHGNEQESGVPAWGFVAFVIVITAIAVAAVLLQIYLQNPQ
jgi:hypothetical protein